MPRQWGKLARGLSTIDSLAEHVYSNTARTIGDSLMPAPLISPAIPADHQKTPQNASAVYPFQNNRN